MAAKKYPSQSVVMQHAKSVVSGKKIACKELIQGCQRFLDDLKIPHGTLSSQGCRIRHPVHREYLLPCVQGGKLMEQGNVELHFCWSPLSQISNLQSADFISKARKLEDGVKLLLTYLEKHQNFFLAALA